MMAMRSSTHAALSSRVPLRGGGVNRQAGGAERRTAGRQEKAVTTKAAQLEVGPGLLGNKAGMTQIFEEGGAVCTPVTVVKIEGGNYVTQKKTRDRDGYNALQVGYEQTQERKITRPEMGHLTKSGIPPLRHLEEFRLRFARHVDQFEVGDQIDPTQLFSPGDVVDVRGTTIGRGFQGHVKRWGHSRGPETHGSGNIREIGTMGGRTPKRCVPGRRQQGKMGNRQTKMRRLVVKSVASDHIVIKGSLPGKAGSRLRITPAKIVGVNVRG